MKETKRITIYRIGFHIVMCFTLFFIYSCSNSSISPFRVNLHTITITGCNTKDSSLKLSPDSLIAYSEDEVNWKIAPEVKVKSFKIFKKNSSPEGFKSNRPAPSYHIKEGKGQLKKVKSPLDYYYNIEWIDSEKNLRYLYDPKISIKPTRKAKLQYIINILSFILAPLLTFLGLRSMLKKDA